MKELSLEQKSRLKAVYPNSWFYVQQNVGKAKYVVSYHNGVKRHADGSPFCDVEIFKNRNDVKKFTDCLIKSGYRER